MRQMIADAHRRGRFEVESLGIEIANGDLGPTLETAIEALKIIRDLPEQAQEIATAALVVVDPYHAEEHLRRAGIEVEA